MARCQFIRGYLRSGGRSDSPSSYAVRVCEGKHFLQTRAQICMSKWSFVSAFAPMKPTAEGAMLFARSPPKPTERDRGLGPGRPVSLPDSARAPLQPPENTGDRGTAGALS